MENGTLKVQNIQTSSGSGTITLGQSGETLALGSGVTSKMNHPAFFAYKDATSNLTDATYTTVVCNVETLDTDNGYDTSTGKYTIPVAGKYSVYFGAQGKADGNGRCERVICRLLRERSGQSDFYVGYGEVDFRGNAARSASVASTSCYEFNQGDILYPQIYVDVNAGTPTVQGSSSIYITYIGAYRIGA